MVSGLTTHGFSMRVVTLAFVVLGAVGDKEDSAAGMTVKVLGQSGKANIYKTDLGESDPAKVTITMDALRELDSAGNTVGTSGATKHSVQSFASQSFTFGDIEAVELGENATASKLSFTAAISTVGQLRVDMFLVTSPGAVGPNGDDWLVSPGDFKFNIAFDQWTWCNPCKKGDVDEVGAFIDLDISIKGQSSAATQVDEGSDDTMDLGGDVQLQLTDAVTIDGVDTTMPSGYPKITSSGGSQVFTFRFPKFETSSLYDPVLNFGGEETPFATDTTGTTEPDGALVDAAGGVSASRVIGSMVLFITVWMTM